jgi:hypothetical protein
VEYTYFLIWKGRLPGEGDFYTDAMLAMIIFVIISIIIYSFLEVHFRGNQQNPH